MPPVRVFPLVLRATTAAALCAILASLILR
jgi:hypothetical protein